jgi:hypothetical protein
MSLIAWFIQMNIGPNIVIWIIRRLPIAPTRAPATRRFPFRVIRHQLTRSFPVLLSELGRQTELAASKSYVFSHLLFQTLYKPKLNYHAGGTFFQHYSRKSSMLQLLAEVCQRRKNGCFVVFKMTCQCKLTTYFSTPCVPKTTEPNRK